MQILSTDLVVRPLTPSPLHHLAATLCIPIWTEGRVVITLHILCEVAHGEDKCSNLAKAGAFPEGILIVCCSSILLQPVSFTPRTSMKIYFRSGCTDVNVHWSLLCGGNADTP